MIYPLPRRRVFRAYSAEGRILGGRLVEPDEEPDDVLTDIFTNPAVALVHVRAVEFGCFLYAAHR